ncbi:hypothetical protein Csa_016280 [Cucumis sativus]|uniref:Uncharacterized protein n=1 Tax=Cucumis sativus TaxID=3659 RepID=A0A0A0K4K8_CUCSA|nr:hypothetical protein Csa_016280 [Cucumis sativus]
MSKDGLDRRWIGEGCKTKKKRDNWRTESYVFDSLFVDVARQTTQASFTTFTWCGGWCNGGRLVITNGGD